MRPISRLVLLLLAGALPVHAAEHDLVIRGGTILDGSGAEGCVGIS